MIPCTRPGSWAKGKNGDTPGLNVLSTYQNGHGTMGCAHNWRGIMFGVGKNKTNKQKPEWCLE